MIDDRQKRAIWYNHTNTRFEIIKALRHKELQIIGEGISIRWLNAQHVGIWDTIRRSLNLIDRKANHYMSMDYYKSIPLMSFNFKKRKEEMDAWAKVRADHVIDVDFGIDIDYKEGDWKDAMPDNQTLRDIFDHYGVKYANWMSGGHGFHFVIPAEEFPDHIRSMPYSHRIALYREIAGLLHKHAPGIDLSIYMATRVLKCPYTITKQGHVVLPLGPEDWEALKKGELSLDPVDVLKNIKNLGFRGIYLNGKPGGMTRFIEEWEGQKHG